MPYKDKERGRQNKLEYYQVHKEEIKAKKRLRYKRITELDGRAALNKKQREWYSKNIEQQRERAREQRRVEKSKVLTHYSNGEPVCACCGEKEVVFLSIDHINGRGGEKTRRSGWLLYRKLRQLGYPEGYRVLCHNCNQAFGILGYCPHEKEGGEEEE